MYGTQIIFSRSTDHEQIAVSIQDRSDCVIINGSLINLREKVFINFLIEQRIAFETTCASGPYSRAKDGQESGIILLNLQITVNTTANHLMKWSDFTYAEEELEAI